MNRRYCDTGRVECPHLPECKWECHYDNATTKTIPIRRVEVVEEVDEAPDHWYKLWQFLIGFTFAAMAVMVALLLVTGAWIWSLLI